MNDFTPQEESFNEGVGESIKLVKNSKGYNWEIKLRDMNQIDLQLQRLDDINKRMIEKYGSA